MEIRHPHHSSKFSTRPTLGRFRISLWNQQYTTLWLKCVLDSLHDIGVHGLHKHDVCNRKPLNECEQDFDGGPQHPAAAVDDERCIRVGKPETLVM